MFKKAMGIVAVVALLGVASQSTGCGKKDVKKYCSMLKKCSDEIAEATVEKQKLPKSTLPAMKASVKKQFGDVKKCEKKGNVVKGWAKKCLKADDCKVFAKCVVDGIAK